MYMYPEERKMAMIRRTFEKDQAYKEKEKHEKGDIKTTVGAFPGTFNTMRISGEHST